MSEMVNESTLFNRCLPYCEAVEKVKKDNQERGDWIADEDVPRCAMFIFEGFRMTSEGGLLSARPKRWLVWDALDFSLRSK